jgi:pilus assembly protein CpaB
MNRQTRTLVVLIVAVVTATLASYAVYRAIGRIPVRTVEVPTTFAVVAAKSMPMGTLVTKDSVKLVAWPARTPLAGGFSSIDGVVDRGLIAAVEENEPLSESKLAPKEAGAGLPPSIPPGMRAMSVKVNEVIGVAGFVVPGTRVDVMCIMHQKEDTMARVVVNNVQVLTAGTRFDQENAKNGQPIAATVITLLVTPEDSERIALAQSEGQIMLSLRNPMDTAASDTKGIRAGSLLGVSVPPPADPTRITRKPIVAAPLPPPEPVRTIYTVEAIRAAKRTEEPVR